MYQLIKQMSEPCIEVSKGQGRAKFFHSAFLIYFITFKV
jgi:hypothetical protein